MKHFSLSFIFTFLLILHLQARGQDQCFECHKNAEDNPSKLFDHDIHHQKGITCAGCHGGNSQTDDMEQAMNKKAGFIGNILEDLSRLLAPFM